MKIKLTWKIWILIIFLIFSLISIFGLPPKSFQKGVLVTSVEPNSTAFTQGFREGQIIKSIDSKKINDLDDFSDILSRKFINNNSQSVIFTLKNSEVVYFSDHFPEITVSNTPKTNLRPGLDLSGGARAIVKAQNHSLLQSEARDLADVTENRLNEFGLTDLKVRPVSDLEGNNFVLIEIAGTTPNDLKDLVSQQGKFEAKIGNETVFEGGVDKDIASVCRGDSTCAYIEQCNQNSDGSYFCNFKFEITLSPEAAKRHAKITETLTVNSTPQGRYLSLPLDLYLDDKLVDSLLISESLKGRITTQVVISGSGKGSTQKEAIKNTEKEMHKLQTILITGSFPYKLEIVKLDTISPVLGNEFTKIILIAGFIALISASLVVFVGYRSLKSSLSLIFVSFSEVVIILGVAALIRWNLDLPSIAGILATIGTGFDDQIVILDEAKHARILSLKQRIKRAFAIILGAYFTSVVSLLPLLWAGAGLLKGFAFTTIIGISIGVFVTRPAFSDIVKKIEE